MRDALLEVLRCPYCGGRLAILRDLFHRLRRDGSLRDGILGCHCCIFPVVDDIPVLHLQPAATQARALMESGRPDRALHAMMGLDDAATVAAFEAATIDPEATYRTLAAMLDQSAEGCYFLYRFSDPTYLVADAVVRAVAAAALRDGGRALDVCGGSGHVTRALATATSEPPVLADLFFTKLWLAQRFVAPDCDPVCCDANGPLPFARGGFAIANCTDAIMFIWMKRGLVSELERLVRDDERSAIVIGHAHNETVWSPSHGQALSPPAYAALFERLPVRMFGESALLADIVAGGPLDLSRDEIMTALEHEPALTMIATIGNAVFVPHAMASPPTAVGHYRLNPLYEMEYRGRRVRLRLAFPSADYAGEFAACRAYLPADLVVDRAIVDELPASRLCDAGAELLRRRVILDLPPRYW